MEQAAALVPVLAAFGVSRVVSSPWARCEKTVRPYADKTSSQVALEAALSEAGHKQRPRAVADLLAEKLDGGRSTVICTHRPVLATVTRTLAEVTPIRLSGSLPRSNPFLRPSEALVVHMAHRPAHAPRAVSVEQWHPLAAIGDD